MSNNLHDAHNEATRRNSFCCGNGNNIFSAARSFRSAKISTGVESESNPTERYEAQGGHDVKVEIRSECLNLLGDNIFMGQLALDKKNLKEDAARLQFEARITAKEFTWGCKTLKMVDIVSVSHVLHTRRFTVHSYPQQKSRWPCHRAHRRRQDINFLAPTPEEACKWVDYQNDSLDCQLDSRMMLVVLNPRSGRGRARKIYDSKVEPILKLAGIRLTVVETNGPHHARRHAATMDLSNCTDGIICVGGDGIVNEVLNGLLSRDDAKSRTVPIGIIPAGSDNSLIWTVMGIRDPISAALGIVKGEMISTDVISVEWLKTGEYHLGHTITYYGFMSDVLELSEKYQSRFGPLRYFVAGAQKFLCLRGYDCEVEYLPVSSQEHKDKMSGRLKQGDITPTNFDDPSDIEIPVRIFNGDSNLLTPRSLVEHDLNSSNISANNEPSEFVRALDTRSKRSLTMRVPLQTGAEEVVTVNHSVSGPTTPSPRPRTRTKSRIDRGWSGRGSSNGNSKPCWDYAAVDCTTDAADEDFAASSGSKWALQQENSFDLKVKYGNNGCAAHAAPKDGGWNINDNENWTVRQGPLLGVMICNHKCKTVQCLESQVMAPSAEPDDRSLDLLIVHNVGRLRLIQFLILMQFGRHLSLPFVEYTKVQAVKLKPGNKTSIGCGIDGELMHLNEPISVTLFEDQQQFLGHSENCARE
ncbi:hypothetical protein KP509_28G046500 [Ceratopteris richardii]|uniref:DAGKc domain-containing protein n=1 Tax=Ceratopteris richardii TaxID=49495 RepID=A0A8T2RDL4_CERRI|nr:hypothetical protein KP509_28G046500 [Ceratopteris richardii]